VFCLLFSALVCLFLPVQSFVPASPPAGARRSGRHADSPRKSLREASGDEEEEEEEAQDARFETAEEALERELDSTVDRRRRSGAGRRSNVPSTPTRSSYASSSSSSRMRLEEAVPLSASDSAKMERAKKFFAELDKEPLANLFEIVRR
jgi:hypothetical protein